MINGDGVAINKAEIPEQAVTKRISDMPATICAQVRVSLSGMEFNTEKVIVLEGAKGSAACYLIAKDSAGRMYSMMLSREPQLDTTLILAS